jgi:hypothetical protein
MPATTVADAPTSTKYDSQTIDSALSTMSKPSFPGYPFSSNKIDSIESSSSDGGFLSKLNSIRGNLDLPSPGSFEALHRESRGIYWVF